MQKFQLQEARTLLPPTPPDCLLALALDDGAWDVGDNFTLGSNYPTIFSLLHTYRVRYAASSLAFLFLIALISALRPRIDMGGPPSPTDRPSPEAEDERGRSALEK